MGMFDDIICEKELPLTEEILNSRNKFIYWLVDMHNIVNESKNKPILSYQDAFNKINYSIQYTIILIKHLILVNKLIYLFFIIFYNTKTTFFI